jgi:hypothetical protein
LALAREAQVIARRYIPPLALLIGLIVALGSSLHGSHASQRQTHRYVGSIVGDPAATVKIEVTRAERRRVEVRAENLLIRCDDGSAVRSTPFSERASFRGKSFFLGADSLYDDSGEQYTEVSGRLLQGGRAKGEFIFISDATDNPLTTDSGGIDCGTGLLSWKAHPVQP